MCLYILLHCIALKINTDTVDRAAAVCGVLCCFSLSDQPSLVFFPVPALKRSVMFVQLTWVSGRCVYIHVNLYMFVNSVCSALLALQ